MKTPRVEINMTQPSMEPNNRYQYINIQNMGDDVWSKTRIKRELRVKKLTRILK